MDTKDVAEPAVAVRSFAYEAGHVGSMSPSPSCLGEPIGSKRRGLNVKNMRSGNQIFMAFA